MDNYFTLISLNEQLNVINQIVLAKRRRVKRYQTQYNVGSISK